MIGKVNYLSRLKKLRKSKGVTQQELANELRYSQQVISNYEAGEREPQIQTLIKLADYFDVSIDYLVGRSDKK